MCLWFQLKMEIWKLSVNQTRLVSQVLYWRVWKKRNISKTVIRKLMMIRGRFSKPKIRNPSNFQKMYIWSKYDYAQFLVKATSLRKNYDTRLRILQYVKCKIWNIFHTWNEKIPPCEWEFHKCSIRESRIFRVLGVHPLWHFMSPIWLKFTL